MQQVTFDDNNWITDDFALESKFLDGQLLFVPQELFEKVDKPFTGMRIEKKELICLIWSVIKSARKEHKRSKWKRIHHTRFTFACSLNSVGEALDWLIENRFVEIPKGRKSYQVGKKSLRYRTIRQSDSDEGNTRRSALVELKNKNILFGIQRFTQADPACEYTRECLDALEINVESAKRQLRSTFVEYVNAQEGKEARKGKKPTKERMFFTLGISLLGLINQCGSVKRGQKGNRLFSPLVGLKKTLRHCLSLSGEELTIWDAQAAQPCLTANLSGDQMMVEDCCSKEDRFYRNVQEALRFTTESQEQRRSKAKKRYCSYAYDKERPNSPVGQMMGELYPTAAEYIREKKRGNYKAFSWAQQREEAAIFVDGVYLRMREAQIPGLTIHDGILCRKKEKFKVKEIIDEELKNREYEMKIKEEEIKQPEGAADNSI